MNTVRLINKNESKFKCYKTRRDLYNEIEEREQALLRISEAPDRSSAQSKTETTRPSWSSRYRSSSPPPAIPSSHRLTSSPRSTTTVGLCFSCRLNRAQTKAIQRMGKEKQMRGRMIGDSVIRAIAATALARRPWQIGG